MTKPARQGLYAGRSFNAIEAMAANCRAHFAPAGCESHHGWFFRAESFFSVARYLDEVSSPYAEFPVHSHGEGFMRFFEERCQRQGIYHLRRTGIRAVAARQMEFLKLMRRMDQSGHCQIIMATHSPMLMAYPDARLFAAVEVWPGAGDREGDGSLQGHA